MDGYIHGSNFSHSFFESILYKKKTFAIATCWTCRETFYFNLATAEPGLLLFRLIIDPWVSEQPIWPKIPLFHLDWLTKIITNFEEWFRLSFASRKIEKLLNYYPTCWGCCMNLTMLQEVWEIMPGLCCTYSNKEVIPASSMRQELPCCLLDLQV